MRSALPTISLLTLLAFGPLVLSVAAQTPEPGSLLVYPMFDNRPGQFTIFSVTNTSQAPFVSNDQPSGNVSVRFVFVEEGCGKRYAAESLTPNDNFTGFVRALNGTPNSRGYFFVYASDGGDDGEGDVPIVFNELIGTTVHIDGIRRENYELLPSSYQGIGEPRQPTDINGDGVFGLDGSEYTTSPGELLFPLFLGQSNFGVSSDLILVSLSAVSGGSTSFDLVIYNDNEELFSAEYQFGGCWSRVALRDISSIFLNSFLANSTNDAPNEFLGFPFVEAGWIRGEGAFFFGQDEALVNPAMLGTLLRRGGDWTVHPFGDGENPNGRLSR